MEFEGVSPVVGGVACLVMSFGKVPVGVACVGVGVVCVMTSSDGEGRWLPWEKGRSEGRVVISPTATRCLLPNQSRPHPSSLEVENREGEREGGRGRERAQ